MWAVGIGVQVYRTPSLRAPRVCGVLAAQGWAQECPGDGWALVHGLWLLQPGQLCWLHLAPLGLDPSSPREPSQSII